jgi:hypothetical protein
MSIHIVAVVRGGMNVTGKLRAWRVEGCRGKGEW